MNNKKQIINKCKEYIKYNYNNNLDSNIYFCSFAESIGFYKLKIYCYQRVMDYLMYFIYKIKNNIGIFFIKNFLIIPSNKINVNLKKAFITYGVKEDFDQLGNFNDRYFSNINKEQSIIFVIYLSQHLPTKIPQNTVLIKQQKKFNIKSFCLFLKLNKYSFNSIKFLSREYIVAQLINLKLENFLKKFKLLKKVNMLYESQLLHLNLIKLFRKKKIITNGYIHSILPALPTNLLFKKPCPDKIFASGDDTIKILKTLGWNKKKISSIKSIRFYKSKDIANNMCNKLFLPIQIKDYDFYERIIKKFFLLNKKLKINLEIKEHPIANKNSKYISFIYKLKKYLNLKNTTLKKKLKISFFIGSTSSVIEALERGLKVIHFVDDPVFQLYENSIFKNIISRKLMDGVYSYKLLKKESYLKLK